MNIARTLVVTASIAALLVPGTAVAATHVYSYSSPTTITTTTTETTVSYTTVTATETLTSTTYTYSMYYDPSEPAALWGSEWDYIVPGSDTRLLTDADLRNLGPYMLYLARNEIYARHGYSFQNADLRSFFNGKAWYMPLYDATTFNDGVLSYTEQRNIALILQWEEYWGSNRGVPVASQYVIEGSDTRLLTDNDLLGLSTYELFLARNEIYARHGYIFSRADLASYFSGKTWYRPLYTSSQFNDGVLSYTEQKNIALILQWEQYRGSSYVPSSSTPATVPTVSSGYIIPGSDTRLLTDSDVCHLSQYQLRLARNEIYARHGYIFQSDDLNDYFMSKSWYVPRYDANTFDSSCLSYTEQRNIALISSYER